MNPTSNSDRISAKERWSYGIGSIGNNIIYGLMTTYLLYYYSDVYIIPLAVVGTMFIVVRIFDAINDPIFGFLIDNTHSRWGRFRPYLLFAPFAMAMIVALVFLSPNLSPTGMIIWAFITYTSWSVAFTLMDVPFWSMSAALTQDPKERSNLIMLPRALAVVGIIGANVVTIPLVKAFGGSENSTKGWFYLAILFGILAIVMTLITFFNVKERDFGVKRERNRISDVIKLFKTNKPLLLLLVSMLIGDMTIAFKTAFSVYYVQYNYNAPEFIPIAMGIYAFATIAGYLLGTPLSNRIGKRNGARLGLLITVFAAVGLFLSGYHSLVILCVWIAIGGFADGATDLARMSMLADTVEYGELKTGKRQEGIIFSTNTFKTKIASAIAGGGAAYILLFLKYQQNSTQTTVTLNGIHFSFALIPGILALISFIPLSWYNLNEKRFQEIVNELHMKENQHLGEDDN